MRKRMDQRGPPRRREPVSGTRHGVARVLSKAGYCSRTAAAALVREGRVRVAGRVVHDPEFPVSHGIAVTVDGRPLSAAARVHVMLNKPRGVTTTTKDERGRDTVYACVEGSGLPWLAPVGRLDRASEGLLLLTNDPEWAAHVTGPGSRIEKTYHVQVDCIPDDATLRAIESGVEDGGEPLSARRASLLRTGERNAWLEIVLDEGRNRQIRRLLAALGIEVLRLVRISIGPVVLGALAKGAWRHLTAEEIAALSATRTPSARE
jgi:23S rRNA pseudouridine2605 synthase